MDSETRALRRTALFLLTVSVFRWVAARPTSEPLVSESARIDQLIDSSRAAEGIRRVPADGGADDQRRRADWWSGRDAQPSR